MLITVCDLGRHRDRGREEARRGNVEEALAHQGASGHYVHASCHVYIYIYIYVYSCIHTRIYIYIYI